MHPEDAKRVIEILSDKWADKYIRKYNAGPDLADHYLNNPDEALEFIIRRGFARAGAEQAGYEEIAVSALEASIEEAGSYSNLLGKKNAFDILWRKFKNLCDKKGKKPNENLNKGVIKCAVELAKRSEDYNPFRYFKSNLVDDALKIYSFLVSFQVIGGKVASLILRDVCSVLNLEREIRKRALANQILFQPIDRWVRSIATCLWDDFEEFQMSLGNYPYVIALRIVKECWRDEECGKCSPIRFNQGAWMYGSSMIKNTKETCRYIRELAKIA